MTMRLPLLLVLALAGCATAGGIPRAMLAVTLTGVQEVPGPGDPDGTGTAEIEVDPRTNQVCWNLYVRQVDAATFAHIHRGVAGAAGPPVVPMTTPGADGHSRGCATVDPMLARELAGRAHEFYVNVHTQAFPAGAVRGQLRGGAVRRERQRLTPQ
jgi:hypothetical protein